MRRRALLVAPVTFLCLVGCGGDPIEDYCDAVQEREGELGDALVAGGPESLLAALPVFEELEDEAPEDIRDEWEQVTGALAALEEALADGGVDPATYDVEKPPEGLSQVEQQRIEAAATELTSAETRAAMAGVEQQARDVCQTPLFW